MFLFMCTNTNFLIVSFISRGEIANCIDELENGYLDRPNLLEFANCLDISEGDSLMVSLKTRYFVSWPSG